MLDEHGESPARSASIPDWHRHRYLYSYGLGIIWESVFGRASVEFTTIAFHLVQICSKMMNVGPRTTSLQVQVSLRMVVDAFGSTQGRVDSIFWLQRPCLQIL